MTDPISDMLVRIQNAYLARKPELSLPYSKFKFSLATILKRGGWIGEVSVVDADESMKMLALKLRYDGGQPAVSGVRRVSKPGQRIYSGTSNLRKAAGQLGATIVSTSKGLMTEKQARREKVGGEVICQIW